VRVLHAHWRPSSQDGDLLFWAEVQPDGATGRSSRKHPFCADADALRLLLGESGAEVQTFTLLLPGNSAGPFPLRNCREWVGGIEATAPCVPGRYRAYGLPVRSRCW
jgi:hypothetical protein